MQYREFIKPSNHSPHWKNTQTILVAPICGIGIIGVVGSLGNSCTYFLIFPFLNDNIDSHNWLLESLNTSCEKLFDLGIP